MMIPKRLSDYERHKRLLLSFARAERVIGGGADGILLDEAMAALGRLSVPVPHQRV